MDAGTRVIDASKQRLRLPLEHLASGVSQRKQIGCCRKMRQIGCRGDVERAGVQNSGGRMNHIDTDVKRPAGTAKLIKM